MFFIYTNDVPFSTLHIALLNSRRKTINARIKMPKYTYCYFNARGRGEVPRLIFAAAGVQYEDKRLELADWPKLKADTPLGTLPVLQIDGKKYPESIPISRHLAREFGLDGKTNIEKLEADIVVEECIQLREESYLAHVEKDEALKAQKLKKVKEETIPKVLGFIEKMLSGNSKGKGFIVGNQLTWADLTVIDTMERLPELLSKYTKLAAHKQMIEGLPKLAAYISKRPKTDK